MYNLARRVFFYSSRRVEQNLGTRLGICTMICLIPGVFPVGEGVGVVLKSFGFVRFVMHKFREDREGVARRLKGRQANGKFC